MVAKFENVKTLMEFLVVKLMSFIEHNFPPKLWEGISYSRGIFHFATRFSKIEIPLSLDFKQIILSSRLYIFIEVIFFKFGIKLDLTFSI
jgi:hypothetical protein